MKDDAAQPPKNPKGYVVLREAQPMVQPPVRPPSAPVPVSSAHTDGFSKAWLLPSILLGVLLVIVSPLLLFFWDVYAHGLNFGRPFRVRRRSITARVAPSSGWIDPLSVEVEELDPATRQALGAAWLDDAQAEHASVAAFGRLSLELLAVGTPPPLLAAVHQAALDEIRHARLCFSLAALYTTQQLGAGPFPEAAIGDSRRWPQERTQQLILLATEALRDGCLGEGASAALLAEVAAEAAPCLRQQLARVAEEERHHAELSFSLLEFCLTTGGPLVRRAVERTLAGLSMETPVPKQPVCNAALWRTHGRATPAQVQRCYGHTLLAVRRRTAELLANCEVGAEEAAA